MLDRIATWLATATTITFAATFSLFLGLAQAQNSGTFPASGGGGGTPGGSNTQVQFNNSSAFGGSSNLTWVSPALTVGTQQTTRGQVVLANTAAGAFPTTLQASNSASAAWTMTLPTTAGTNLFVLQTDGSGNTSWVAQTGGGGSPGGASNTVQYNNGGAFGGMSGTAWNDTNRSLTMTGATVTTSNPTLNMSQTWNAGGVAFTGLQQNITNTASAAGSKPFDFQVGGQSYFRSNTDGSVVIDQQFTAVTTNVFTVNFQGTSNFRVADNGGVFIDNASGALFLQPAGTISWSGNGTITAPSSVMTLTPGSGHITFAGGSVPTASACAGFALGTNSSDAAGRVTFTSATTCNISFGTAYASAPFCNVTPGSAVSTVFATTSTTVLSVTFGTANTSMFYQCFGK